MEQNKKETEKGSKLAKLGRIITVPPFIITALFLVLWKFKGEMFQNSAQLLFSILFLGVMPILAYLVHFLIPSLRRKGRKMQRNLAFAFTFVGYFAAFVYGICVQAEAKLQLIYCTYFVAALILSIFNFVFRKKASGHACSIVAPIIILLLYSLYWWAILFLVMGFISIWSSLYLKRHLPKELVLGACCSIISVLLSVVLFRF